MLLRMALLHSFFCLGKVDLQCCVSFRCICESLPRVLFSLSHVRLPLVIQFSVLMLTTSEKSSLTATVLGNCSGNTPHCPSWSFCIWFSTRCFNCSIVHCGSIACLLVYWDKLPGTYLRICCVLNFWTLNQTGHPAWHFKVSVSGLDM